MVDTFDPRLDILPAAQRRLWDELGQILPQFVLYGGTAVALHLGHRQSVDFDFFGGEDFEPAALTRTIPFMADAVITQQAPSTLSATLDRGGPVKVSFFGLPSIRPQMPPQIAPGTGLKVASLLDLAGMKAAVVQQRAEAKDYLDIDAILADGRIDLPLALAAASAIYGRQFNPQITLKALSFFADGDLPGLPGAVQQRLAEAARKVDLDSLPALPHAEPPR
ncbi:MAG TPA: nucleotidyl transferase AbiEii/AbiGii toxin family protein [Aliidongia sp.]|nr:nucleotidyl transferase AbiEii/AbiGii toxin family protein [Aliidongia sp.]